MTQDYLKRGIVYTSIFSTVAFDRGIVYRRIFPQLYHHQNIVARAFVGLLPRHFLLFIPLL